MMLPFNSFKNQSSPRDSKLSAILLKMELCENVIHYILKFSLDLSILIIDMFP